jgi:hypothetical protein
MVLKGFVTKEEYDGLDPIIREEYKEEGNGFTLDVKAVNGWGFAQLDGLKNTASKERDSAKSYYAQLRKYKGENGEFIDPEEAKEALANKEKYLKAGKDKATVDEQVRERMKQADENWRKELKKRDDKIEKLTGVVRTEKIDNRIKTACSKTTDKRGKGKPYLNKLVRSMMEMKENDAGELYEVLLDDDGKEMYSAKDPSRLMTLDELLDNMANDEETADLFEGSGAKGAGTQTSEKGHASSRFDQTRDGDKRLPRTIKSDDMESIQKYADEIAANEIEIVD